MKIYLKEQSGKLGKHLEELKSRDIKKYDRSKIKEKITTIPINSNKTLEQTYLKFFFDYRIFPEKILTFLSQWNAENRNMQVGDTIVQQVFLPPINPVSGKIIFGVRINRIFSSHEKRGFSYETLEGHIETGESSFTIEKIPGDSLICKIHTFSGPGNFLTRLVNPIFAAPYQSYCTKLALENIKRQIELL